MVVVDLFQNIDDTTIPNLWAVAALADETAPDNETSLNFVMESVTDGDYDYKNGALSIDSNTGEKYDNTRTAYMIGGVLTNRNEAGNMLWGATAAKVGLPANWARAGGQLFTIMVEQKRDEVSEQRAIVIGHTAFMDFRSEKVIKKK